MSVLDHELRPRGCRRAAFEQIPDLIATRRLQLQQRLRKEVGVVAALGGDRVGLAQIFDRLLTGDPAHDQWNAGNFGVEAAQDQITAPEQRRRLDVHDRLGQVADLPRSAAPGRGQLVGRCPLAPRHRGPQVDLRGQRLPFQSVAVGAQPRLLQVRFQQADRVVREPLRFFECLELLLFANVAKASAKEQGSKQRQSSLVRKRVEVERATVLGHRRLDGAGQRRAVLRPLGPTLVELVATSQGRFRDRGDWPSGTERREQQASEHRHSSIDCAGARRSTPSDGRPSAGS
jgi:hypothetical protein